MLNYYYYSLTQFILHSPDHVLVKCHKGFDDTNTRKAIPCLWRRKSFVDNCKMFDVKRIVFLDSVNRTFDELKPLEIDASTLP